MGNMISQSFPPTPKLTEKNLEDQSGKVFIVTGGSSGVGRELAQILYRANANVYIAARNLTKTEAAMTEIKTNVPSSKGQLNFLHLDLDDLSTIKKSAEEFLGKEKRLDVLWNNAGVMIPPDGSKTKQGYELQLGTNCLAPFLFTEFLTPLLIATAKTSPPASTRVVWVSSSAGDLMSPKHGVDMDNLDYKKPAAAWTKYGVSKAGNYLHATSYARRHSQEHGIVSLALNPGNLKTDLQRHVGGIQMMFLSWMLYKPIFGAYTELYAGLSKDITMEKTGSWVIPWGRDAKIRKDVEDSSKTVEEGGSGVGEKFWAWSEEQVKPYM